MCSSTSCYLAKLCRHDCSLEGYCCTHSVRLSLPAAFQGAAILAQGVSFAKQDWVHPLKDGHYQLVNVLRSLHWALRVVLLIVPNLMDRAGELYPVATIRMKKIQSTWLMKRTLHAGHTRLKRLHTSCNTSSCMDYVCMLVIALAATAHHWLWWLPCMARL